jgi:hypothetical protein
MREGGREGEIGEKGRGKEGERERRERERNYQV